MHPVFCLLGHYFLGLMDNKGMKELAYIFLKEAMGGRLIRITLAEIMYLVSKGNYVQIICDKDKRYLIHRSLHKLLNTLSNPKLCRIHQSHVVNIDHIVDVDGNIVNLQNGVGLEIGPTYRKAFLEMLMPDG